MTFPSALQVESSVHEEGTNISCPWTWPSQWCRCCQCRYHITERPLTIFPPKIRRDCNSNLDSSRFSRASVQSSRKTIYSHTKIILSLFLESHHNSPWHNFLVTHVRWMNAISILSNRKTASFSAIWLTPNDRTATKSRTKSDVNARLARQKNAAKLSGQRDTPLSASASPPPCPTPWPSWTSLAASSCSHTLG